MVNESTIAPCAEQSGRTCGNADIGPVKVVGKPCPDIGGGELGPFRERHNTRRSLKTKEWTFLRPHFGTRVYRALRGATSAQESDSQEAFHGVMLPA